MFACRNSSVYPRWFMRFCSFSSSSASKKTHFGFQTVDENEKSKKVHEVFENVATRYDLMNDVMSFGIHRIWKDRFVEKLNPSPNIRLLDVAGGTGDIAFRVLRHIVYKLRQESSNNAIADPYAIQSPLADDKTESRESSAAGYSLTICDINQAMLDVGRQRALAAGTDKGVHWVQGDAECLPFPDNEFDAYTIAFGIRNCTHVNKVLEEAYRVLRRGGRLMCLEFSQVQAPLVDGVYDWYSFQVIPVMGQIFAADWHSYQYLVESIRQFPNQTEFASMIRDAGFKYVSYDNLSFGVVSIHSGFKL